MRSQDPTVSDTRALYSLPVESSELSLHISSFNSVGRAGNLSCTPRPPFNPGYSRPHPAAVNPELPPVVVVTSRPPFVPRPPPPPHGNVDDYGAPLAPAVTSRSTLMFVLCLSGEGLVQAKIDMVKLSNVISDLLLSRPTMGTSTQLQPGQSGEDSLHKLKPFSYKCKLTTNKNIPYISDHLLYHQTVGMHQQSHPGQSRFFVIFIFYYCCCIV